jgi:hypothetical protein
LQAIAFVEPASSRVVAVCYAVFAAMALLLLAPAMPPFQNADEIAHASRADQISHFGLLSTRLPDGDQGGWVDGGLPAAAAPFDRIRYHAAAKVSRGMYVTQDWGSLAPVGFPNTGIYPPTFYVPAAVALGVSRRLHLSVLHGVVAARIATGLTSIATGTVAVALADTGAPWLFAVLMLPMSLALMAAVSQDSLLLACSALAASLCLRLCLCRRPPEGNVGGAWLFASALLALVGMARPPYAILALALLGAGIPLRLRLVALAIAWVPVLAWSLVSAPHIVLPVFPAGAVDPAAQARLLLHAPWRIFGLLAATWQDERAALLQSFIGQLGWLDVSLPAQYRRAAWLMLVVAAWATCGGGVPQVSWPALAAVVGACLGIAMIQYFAWTVPGSPVINGVVGRYFIPPALMLVCAFSSRRGGQAAPFARWAVALFPVITVPVVLHAVLVRYYL